MTKTKRMTINMIAQIIAFGTNFLISFFFTPYIVKNIGEEAFGFVGLANNFINYATIITTALNSMVGRFVTINIHREKYEDVNKYMTSVIIANVCLAIPITIVASLILAFLPKIVDVPQNIQIDVTILWGLLFLNFIIGLIGNVFSVATFSQNRIDLSSKRSIESNVLKVIVLLVLFLLFKPSVWYFGLATLICGIYVIFKNIYYTKKLLPSVKIEKKFIDFTKIKELLLAGGWNSLSAFGRVLSTELDLLITNLFVGASPMGIVSIAKTLPSYVLSLFSTFSGVFAPQLTIDYAKKDYKEMYRELLSAVKFLAFFACIPLACLYAYGEEFFSLWIPGQDAKLIQTLSILAGAAFPISLPLEPLWSIFTITNKLKKSSLFLFANSLLSIIITFTLLGFATDNIHKMYIVVGVSSVIGFIRSFTFLPIYGAKCLKIKLNSFYPVIFKNVFAIIITTIIALAIKGFINIESWISLIIAGGLTVLSTCIINYFIILSNNERQKIKAFIKTFIKGRLRHDS